MFCELSIPSTSASQVETVSRHQTCATSFHQPGYSAGVAAGPDTGRGRGAAGCREYNVEGRLELGTGNTQTHTKQGSSTRAPLSMIMLLLQNGFWDFYHFINKFEKEDKGAK